MKPVVMACLLLPAVAVAGPQLEPIQAGQSYSIDLYSGVPLGNAAVVATGGASQANSIGSSGTLANPSAPAVRQTTDTDVWNWDYHFDYLLGSLSSDYANSGIANLEDQHANTITGGLSVRVKDWGGAITATYRGTSIDTPATEPALTADLWVLKAALAKWVPKIDFAFGASIDIAGFGIAERDSSQQLFSISGSAIEVGTQWIPRHQSFRVGATAVAPVANSKINLDQCTTQSICPFLPTGVTTPGQLAGGVAYRWADTEWNQTVGGTFRDETSVTALFDVLVTGTSPNAYGLDAFGIEKLERSGRHDSVSVRGGVEWEAIPGRLRLRGGSYWEPNRFEGVPGRIHGTFGIEGRAFEFDLWGRRRGRLTLTADLASEYRNLGASIGFWH